MIGSESTYMYMRTQTRHTHTMEYVYYAPPKRNGSCLNERIVVITNASEYLFQHFWKETDGTNKILMKSSRASALEIMTYARLNTRHFFWVGLLYGSLLILPENMHEKPSKQCIY